MADKYGLAKLAKKLEQFFNSVFVRQDGASTMTGALEVLTGSNASQVHVANSGTDGLFLTSTAVGHGSAIFSGGAEFNGTDWVARNEEATIIAFYDGVIYIDIDSGLTPGNTFTPTVRATITTAGIINANSYGIRTKQSVANFSSPPTDAELNAAFGTPETLGRGFMATIDDADGDTTCYLVFTSDASWFYEAMTKAT